MTVLEIDAKVARLTLIHETAKTIRTLLNQASEKLPDDDGEGLDNEILELVTGDA